MLLMQRLRNVTFPRGSRKVEYPDSLWCKYTAYMSSEVETIVQQLWLNPSRERTDLFLWPGLDSKKTVAILWTPFDADISKPDASGIQQWVNDLHQLGFHLTPKARVTHSLPDPCQTFLPARMIATCTRCTLYAALKKGILHATLQPGDFPPACLNGNNVATNSVRFSELLAQSTRAPFWE